MLCLLLIPSVSFDLFLTLIKRPTQRWKRLLPTQFILYSHLRCLLRRFHLQQGLLRSSSNYHWFSKLCLHFSRKRSYGRRCLCFVIVDHIRMRIKFESFILISIENYPNLCNTKKDKNTDNFVENRQNSIYRLLRKHPEKKWKKPGFSPWAVCVFLFCFIFSFVSKQTKHTF